MTLLLLGLCGGFVLAVLILSRWNRMAEPSVHSQTERTIIVANRRRDQELLARAIRRDGIRRRRQLFNDLRSRDS